MEQRHYGQLGPTRTTNNFFYRDIILSPGQNTGLFLLGEVGTRHDEEIGGKIEAQLVVSPKSSELKCRELDRHPPCLAS